MPLWDQNESIDYLNEARVLGYFESIKGIFITKWSMLWTLASNDREHFRADAFPQAVIEDIRALYPFPGAYAALQNPADEHMVANMVDDIITISVMHAWSVFEQLIKHLPNNNYAHVGSQYTADFERRVFAFTAAEKDDLKLIYYIRNAIAHYSGAYNAYKEVDHVYRGFHFQSIGREGQPIGMTEAIAWNMLCDIERLGLKAWTNWKAANPTPNP
jgi:hypothetical protein